MSSILTDLENNFVPVTRTDMLSIGFYDYYASNNIMFNKLIVDTNISMHGQYNVIVPVTYRLMWYEKQNELEILTLNTNEHYRMRYGVMFKPIRLKNATLTEITASITASYLSTRFVPCPKVDNK